MEFDDEKHELMFWYVGLAHDLQRPEGALDSEFCKYAEMYVRQAGEEEERERENGQGGGRRRAKGEEAEEEEEVEMEMEEPEEEMEDEMEETEEIDSSPFLTRSKARSLLEEKVKMEKEKETEKETDESIPEQEDGEDAKMRGGRRKRTKLSGEDEAMDSKKAK